MDYKSAADLEHKYDDSKEESFDWIVLPNGVYNFQGRVPTRGNMVPINLIDDETKTQREGNFYAEEINGGINLIQMIDGQGRIIQRWRSLPPKESFDELWNKQFDDHENIKQLDEMIMEWSENEEYIEVESDKKNHSGSSKGKSSKKEKKIVKKLKIRTVKDKFYVAKGPIQGCKSQYMMDGALKCLKIGKSSIIVFQQTGHLIQFKERLDQEIERIKNNIRLAGRSCTFPLTSVVAKNENFSIDEFVEAVQGQSPKIFLIIGSDKQAGLLNQKFKQVTKKVKEEIMESYVLWVDEADHIDSGTEAKKTISLGTLKKYSYAIVEVSATVLDITGRQDVKPDHLCLLKPPRSYRGVPSFTSIITEEEAKYASKVDANLLKTDRGLKRIIHEFVNNETPTWCSAWNEFHPCIMLVNNGKTIEPQKRMMKDLKRKYSDLVIIVYIGEGLYIHHQRLPTSSFMINGSKSTITPHGHLFKGISPSSVLLWLKRNGGARVFHHILIASGDLAGRSISYACKDTGSSGLPFWHLTHHRLVLPQNSACPAVLQKCRLCTIFESNIPLKLYVSEQDERAVIKSYWSQEEVIERSRSNPNEEYLKEIMGRLELMGEKIPKGRKLTIDKKLKVCKRVKGDDGGLLVSSYKFDGLFDRERDSVAIMIELDDIEREDVKSKEATERSDWKAELAKLEKNIRNAVNRDDDTIVLRILRHFKSLENEGMDAVLDLNTLVRLGVSDRTHYMQWSRPGSSEGQYKILIEQHTGFALNPEIRHLLRVV